MKITSKLSTLLMLAATMPALAATTTVTLDVPSMTCPVCPVTVKKALTAVPGVSKVDVVYAKREATVTYDDTKTTVSALTKATANAGYPSTAEGKVK